MVHPNKLRASQSHIKGGKITLQIIHKNLMQSIKTIKIENKVVILRLDCDTPLNEKGEIIDDIRIRTHLKTIEKLKENGNKLICVAKLGRPDGRDPELSLKPVVKKLQEYLPDFKIKLVDDFLTEDESTFKNQSENEILVLENIRYYKEEKKNDPEFAKKLANLADVFVNDAFAMAHRVEASTMGIAEHLPAYAGLALEREILALGNLIDNPNPPFTAVIGGAKIDSKIGVIRKFIEIADNLIIGGGLANTFLRAKGFSVGESLFDITEIEQARELLELSKNNNCRIILPKDMAIGEKADEVSNEKIVDVNYGEKVEGMILDIGPKTEALLGSVLSQSKTIVWNGPVGFVENPVYSRGTDFIYHSIVNNSEALSIVGGGDTLAAISNKSENDKIDHISTGGGAMLEFIEKEGKLPALEGLKSPFSCPS